MGFIIQLNILKPSTSNEKMSSSVASSQRDFYLKVITSIG